MTDAYVTDLFRPAARGRAVSVVYTLGYIGTPAAGLLAYEAGIVHPWGVAGWRWLVLLSLIGVVLVALARSWLIESPRWLLSVGRETEAQRLIGRLGAAGRDIATSETPTPFAEQGKFEGIFSPRWRRATITLWLINTFSPFAFYGFGTLAPLILKAEGYTLLSSLAYTALSFFGYPIGSALAILFIDRIDRKWIIAGGHFLLGATGLLFVTANSPVLVVCGGFLFSLVSNIVGNANHVYMAELYPTQLRATGNGTAYTINRIATAIMPIVLVPLLDSGGATLVFVIVGAGLMLITFGVGIFGPHSYDSPLEHRRGRSMRRPAFPGHE
jgi:putative MFS transporter